MNFGSHKTINHKIPKLKVQIAWEDLSIMISPAVTDPAKACCTWTNYHQLKSLFKVFIIDKILLDKLLRFLTRTIKLINSSRFLHLLSARWTTTGVGDKPGFPPQPVETSVTVDNNWRASTLYRDTALVHQDHSVIGDNIWRASHLYRDTRNTQLNSLPGMQKHAPYPPSPASNHYLLSWV